MTTPAKVRQAKRISNLRVLDWLFTLAIIPAFFWRGPELAVLCWVTSELYAFRIMVEEAVIEEVD